jgi:hypothetical protein
MAEMLYAAAVCLEGCYRLVFVNKIAVSRTNVNEFWFTIRPSVLELTIHSIGLETQQLRS